MRLPEDSVPRLLRLLADTPGGELDTNIRTFEEALQAAVALTRTDLELWEEIVWRRFGDDEFGVTPEEAARLPAHHRLAVVARLLRDLEIAYTFGHASGRDGSLRVLLHALNDLDA